MSKNNIEKVDTQEESKTLPAYVTIHEAASLLVLDEKSIRIYYKQGMFRSEYVTKSSKRGYRFETIHLLQSHSAFLYCKAYGRMPRGYESGYSTLSMEHLSRIFDLAQGDKTKGNLNARMTAKEQQELMMNEEKLRQLRLQNDQRSGELISVGEVTNLLTAYSLTIKTSLDNMLKNLKRQFKTRETMPTELILDHISDEIEGISTRIKKTKININNDS